MEIGRYDNTINPGVTENRSLPYHAAGVRGQGLAAMVLDSGFSADAMDFSHTRTSANGPGFGASHRKMLAYESTNQFGAGSASPPKAFNPQT